MLYTNHLRDGLGTKLRSIWERGCNTSGISSTVVVLNERDATERDATERDATERDEVCATHQYLQCCFPSVCRYSTN